MLSLANKHSETSADAQRDVAQLPGTPKELTEGEENVGLVGGMEFAHCGTRLSSTDLNSHLKQNAMLHSKMHLFACAALLAATAFPLATVFARPSAPLAFAQVGEANGTLFGPSNSSIGRVHGRFYDAIGAVYQCDGTLEPNNDSGSAWTGYSPTGTIEGTLTPLTDRSQNGLRFWGSYGIDNDGNGSFQAYLTAPSVSAGGARELAGSFSGWFHNAAVINPQTLFPDPGDFQGRWNLGH